MHADPMRLKPAIARRALVDRQRLANIDAEFVLAQSGRNIGMRLGKNVGIHAQRKARLAFELAARAASSSSSASLSTLNSRMPSLQRQVDLRRRLAHA